MPTPKSALVAFAIVFGVAGGCKNKKNDDGGTEIPGAGAQGAQGDGQAAGKPGLAGMSVDGTRCAVDGKQKDYQDLNHDDRADLITLYEGGDSAQKITCKQADLNFDGRLDAFFHYSMGGDVEREQFDLDFDGRIDMGRYYENGELTHDEQDLNQDGAVDTWRYYDKGRLVRLEDDRDANGKPDRYVYYVGGQIDRIGYDVDGDGKVDQWDHDAARRVKLAVQSRAAKKAEEAAKAAEDDEYVDTPDAETEGEEGEGGEDGEEDAKGKDAKGKDAKGKDAKDAKGDKAGDKAKKKGK